MGRETCLGVKNYEKPPEKPKIGDPKGEGSVSKILTECTLRNAAMSTSQLYQHLLSILL